MWNNFFYLITLDYLAFLKKRLKRVLGDSYLTVYPSWCISSNNAWHANGRVTLGWHPSTFDVIVYSSLLNHTEVVVANVGRRFYCSFVYGLYDGAWRAKL